MNELLSVNSLAEFTHHKNVTILCHNFPDADTIASGYALYSYFTLRTNAKVKLIYGGISPISKTNLQLMIKLLHIPIEHVTQDYNAQGLLVSVDCQYLSGNVLDITADEVLIIDHHRISRELKEGLASIDLPIYGLIKDNYGSCATLVYELLQKEHFNLSKYVSTALYYGLFMDTNEFSELRERADIQMRDELAIDDAIFTLIRNSNLTKEELIIVGSAFKELKIHETMAYIEAQECDPNMLGLMADILIMVENVSVAVVYTCLQSPSLSVDKCYKYSVRTCVRNIAAHDFAEKLVSPKDTNGKLINLGYAGGHRLKAGGSLDYQSFNLWCTNELKPYRSFSNYLCESFDEFLANKVIDLSDDFIIDKATGKVKSKIK